MSRRQIYQYIAQDELVISFLVIGQITRNTIIYSSKMSDLWKLSDNSNLVAFLFGYSPLIRS